MCNKAQAWVGAGGMVEVRHLADRFMPLYEEPTLLAGCLVSLEIQLGVNSINGSVNRHQWCFAAGKRYLTNTCAHNIWQM